MIKILISFLSILYFSAISELKAQVHQWAARVGGSASDMGYKTAVDGNGNLYATGSFEGTNVDFDPSPNTFFLSSAGLNDAFIAKYDKDGNFKWAFKIGGSNHDDVGDIVIDHAGKLIITGYFRGLNVDFDPSASTAILNSNGESGGDPGYGGDIFIAKYDTLGNYIWAFNIGGISLGESGIGINVDKNDNILATGYFRGSGLVDFDPSPATALLNSDTGPIYVAKYTSSGQYLWGLNMGLPNADNSGFDIAADDLGDIVVTGYFQGNNIDFDPSPATNALSGHGLFDIFVAKYTSGGQYIWAFNVGGTNSEVGRSLAIDNNNNIYIVGDFASSSVDFDPGPGINSLLVNGANDIFVAKYSPGGQHLWAFDVGGGTTAADLCWHVTLDDQFNVLITGCFAGVNVDFDPSPGTAFLTSIGGQDVYAAKYSANGQYICAFAVGGSSTESSYSISSYGDYCYLSGEFAGNADFDPGPGIYTLTASGKDAFIAKYHWSIVPPAGTLTGSTICKGTQAILTFNATAGSAPFTLTISDGTNTFIKNNVQSGISFNLPTFPSLSTTYTLQSIKDAGNCSPLTPVTGISAVVSANTCGLCTGGLGDPVINITFGNGNNPGPTISTIVPGAATTYSFVPVAGNPAIPMPLDGQYTITNNIPLFAGWFSGQVDHTPNDVNGYMTFFNASQTAGEFYRQTINGLCDNTTYEFASWIANVLNPAVLSGAKPDLTFNIEKTDGSIIASFATGPVNQNATMTWQQFGFYFTTPAGVNSVVLKIINTNPGGPVMPGNDLAIDDITFRACGPLLTASFDAVASQVAKAQCGYAPVNMYGVTSTGYTNPVFLWQVSSNNGVTWTNIAGANALMFSYTPVAAGVYWFRMLSAESSNINSPSCRVRSNIVTLAVNDIPQVNFAGNAVCQGEQATLSFNASGVAPFDIVFNNGIMNISQTGLPASSVYNFSPNITTTSSFSLVSITDASGCTRTNGFTIPVTTITVNPKPVVMISANSSVCSGDSVQLIASGGSGYKWSPPIGLSNTSIPDPKASPPFTTTYKVVVGNLQGCKDSSTTTVAVTQKPVLNIGNDSTFCLDGTITLDATLPGATSYSWNNGASASSITVNQPGVYSVAVEINGCLTGVKDTIVLSTIPYPTVSLGKDTSICSFQTLRITAAGSNIRDYLWNTGVTTSFITTSAPGSYSVIVSNKCGNATDDIVVVPKPCSEDIFFPSAFTPTRDGRNEKFKALYYTGIGVFNFELKVFNRWGEMIFATNDPAKGWDGTFKGWPQDSNIYVWYARYSKASTGPLIFQKGTVTLIR